MPAALATQDRHNRLAHIHHAVEVGVDLGAEVFQGDVFDRSQIAITGVVDHHIEAAKMLHGGVNCLFHLLVVGHVQRQWVNRIAKLGHQVIELLRLAGGGDNTVSGAQGSQSDGATEAAGTASDKPDLGHSNTSSSETAETPASAPEQIMLGWPPLHTSSKAPSGLQKAPLCLQLR